MCRGCGKVGYWTGVTFGPGAPEKSYRTESEILVVYEGVGTLRVTGCVSGNRYIFLSGKTRSVDVNDWECLKEMKFRAVESDNSKAVQSGRFSGTDGEGDEPLPGLGGEVF